MINKDAKPETIAKYKNNLNNITKALKMRGIKYKLIEGSVEVYVGIYKYTYSITKRKWRRDIMDVIKGDGLKDLLEDIDKNKRETK